MLTARAGDSDVLVRIPGRYPEGTGQPVRLWWPEEAVHVFDSASGKCCPPGALPAMNG